MWELNNMLPNNQWVIEEIKSKIKKNTQRQGETEILHTKVFEMQQMQF